MVEKVELENDEELVSFSYDCPDKFSGQNPEECKNCPHRLEEDDVKKAVAFMLRERGWGGDAKLGQEPSIDIEANKGGKVLNIEAKGEGSRPQMRRNYFLAVLGKLLQRMDDPEKEYGIALPAYKQFSQLVYDLPTWIKSHLNLRVFLVHENREVVGVREY